MKLNIQPPDLTQYQKDILYSSARFTITEASTKAGKTFSHLWWIFEQAHADYNREGFNHWWVAPVYSQAKIAFNRLKAIVDTSVYRVNESNLIITTPLGTHIHFKSAEKPDNLFGEDVYSVVFDEAPRARHDAFIALRSTITATKGKMKLIGNHGGVANWVYQLKEKAKTDNNYAYFKITAWDAVKAGILDEDEILQAQKDLPTNVFSQLYLAESLQDDDMLCSYGAIQDVFTNTHLLPEEEKKRNLLTRYITADIALHGSDKFIVLVWQGFTVIDVKAVDKCDAPEVERILKVMATKHKVGRSKIAYDADGLGSFLRGYLRGAIPFNNGGKAYGKNNYRSLKDQCGYELAKVINDAGIYIKADIDKHAVVQELECLKSFNVDKEGKLQLMPKSKIKEIIGRSPDYLDAILMRMVFAVRPKSTAPKARLYD